jgi:hypothetical protein
MNYLLIDPPVSPLSPPAEIQGWIDELLHMAQDPSYVNTEAEKQIASALAQALSWQSQAQQLDRSPDRRAGHPGSP